MVWTFGHHSIAFGARPLVMGIVNVTPDSFSDGGRHATTDAAIEHALRLAAEGADFLDVGGESSRPGATAVALDEELARVVPVVRGLAARTIVPISIDTTKAEVARQAIDAGATIVNDISAGLGDAAMLEVVRASRAGIILMHMKGTPEFMQNAPSYADVTAEVLAFLAERLHAFANDGVPAERIALDPGIGFGKTSAHNLTLLRRLPELNRLGRPIVLGVSRKGFVGHLTGRPALERVAGSLAAAVYCATLGAAHVVRVHDVAQTVDAAKVVEAIERASD